MGEGISPPLPPPSPRSPDTFLDEDIDCLLEREFFGRNLFPERRIRLPVRHVGTVAAGFHENGAAGRGIVPQRLQGFLRARARKLRLGGEDLFILRIR